MQRKSLLDILHNGQLDRLSKSWAATEAAKDFAPLPSGEYVCHVTGGELESRRTNATPGYKIEFTILDGEFAKRKVWHDCWLTEAALPQSKRDLGKLGVTSLDQLNQPLPRGIRCKVRVVLRTDDSGTQFNRVRSFEVVGIDPPEANPFAPQPDGDGQPPADKPPAATAIGADDPPNDDAAEAAHDNPTLGSF
jgi:hypothetical protein